MVPAIKLVALAVAAAFTAQAAPAQHQAHGGDAPATPAGPSHSSPYARGLYLLHNFEYSSAAQAFRDAQKAEPSNVMAYWGEAMTYNHPLWAEQDAAAARAVLARLGPTPAERKAKARTEREAMWLSAVEALYGEGTKLDRDRAYHERMMALFESDPADVDARSFYALATLGLASQGRDTGLYMQAAALLEEAFPSNADHPGVLHYLIHSYDDPVHAPLGVRAARRYATVAPDAGHAQHMISHIFHALGDWQQVEQANVQAMRVVNAQRAARGESPTSCGHYAEWQAYSMMQLGRSAGSLIESCRAQALAELAEAKDASVLGNFRSSVTSWSDMAVRFGIESDTWPLPLDLPPGRYEIARFNLAYAQLLSARTNPAKAAQSFAEMKRSRNAIAAALPREMPDDQQLLPWIDLAIIQGEAVAALAGGNRERGLDRLRTAAATEAALPIPFGPPILGKPSYELLGDEMLAAGNKAEAAKAYRQALAAAPKRRLSLAGLAEASEQALASASTKH